MKTIEVVAAVIKHDNKIFTSRRNYGEFENMWEFPGGKIEEGETREESLIREIKEELELNIEVNKYLTTVEYDYTSFHLIMHCFMCTIIGGELRLNVHNDAKWTTLEELDKFNWIPADILVVEKLKECEKKYGYPN
ncbi:CTP pyrophosphohydrolase [Clostridium saccharobutylicum]|uniref:(deoxy)nucleoside triphosphate pyrophosphohydrolase n=1 Tax=Clostridium saccharobutylicum TaxID=169679 RepID=UPI000983D97B|nr:(deoxy)nucleoside triphosphate pyrophosphohydrolase [Clostridium saccharobutylicum]AQS09840.1 CTP pyrophosphohydrolase [Clostridium saccharobutylicum]MBC2438635.1 (deoxy)nucleoside triphosphate pyrophosphohydrolase [Clostridium saccharobutylicum]NSB90956.1 8-oxo-dGTP diphosphatase [Clostridium saccharobutylicum]NYC27758.1 8-oxo-dGTP diphosphatase [Clostridium saccharobutylicum]OOM13049.1 CTP pyrophosphohydrolase [Clostridium saccharobutylicum]